MRFKSFITFSVFLLFSCTSAQKNTAQKSLGKPRRENAPHVAAFPELIESNSALTAAVQKISKDKRISVDQGSLNATVVPALVHYLSFLGLKAQDLDSPRAPKRAVVDRLFDSSIQFMLCSDLRDWNCLEQTPAFVPAATFRQENQTDLGHLQNAGAALDIEVFFAQAWDGRSNASGVVKALAERLNQDANDGALFAISGIDDVQGSIKPIYDFVESNKKSVKVVFDTAKADDGTLDLVRLLGASAHTQSPSADSWMHDNFVIMQGTQGKSVWTGTGNFSRGDMGSESDSNMSIFIHNNDMIAQAYTDKFNQLFASAQVKTSAGHRNFIFDDGTRVRANFAPTDDAEHRVILPMLYSAKAGDEIRVSMFATSGYEYVRAFQYAEAVGAHVKILLDKQQAQSTLSWQQDKLANLKMPNPYLERVVRPYNAEPGSLEIRLSAWKGRNHLRVGSLTRRQADGSLLVEELIVGSQNWNSSGNDQGDENLVAIQNLKTGILVGVQFNQEFDNHLWASSE